MGACLGGAVSLNPVAPARSLQVIGECKAVGGILWGERFITLQVAVRDACGFHRNRILVEERSVKVLLPSEGHHGF